MAILENVQASYAQVRIESMAGGCRRILWAKVDIADWDLVSGYTWHVTFDGQMAYPATLKREGSGVVSMGRLLLGEGELGNLGRINHKNGNGLDNRRTNLEIASQSKILAKRRPTGGASRYKGVAWDAQQQKWMATFRGKKLGRFREEKDAARAFDEAVLDYWGEDAYLNFPLRPKGVHMTGSAARQLRFAIGRVLDTEEFQADRQGAAKLREVLALMEPWVNLPAGWFGSILGRPDLQPQMQPAPQPASSAST